MGKRNHLDWDDTRHWLVETEWTVGLGVGILALLLAIALIVL